MPTLNLDSYPPMFRSTREPDPNLIKHQGSESMNPLPLIDMQCLDTQELDKACREWGIFRLVNHGVPPRLLAQLQDHAKTIFDLPFETKQDLSKRFPSINYFWGTPALTPSGVPVPRAGGARNIDWVEGFNVPLGQLSVTPNHLEGHVDHDHDHDLDLDNDRDLLIDAFSKLLEDYKGHLTRLALTLFEAMTRRLEIDSQLNQTYLDESSGLVRVYRYPSCKMADNEHVKGMDEHTDSSVLSILNEDEVGGLQFLKDDMWFDVNPIPTTLIVNLGDMMQALSDDEYKSVKHKVRLNKNKERVSICYFVFPEENSLIKSTRYKPFTYNDFRAQVQHDVRTLGWKVGLQNFKLSRKE